jgi:hypothetical protein
VLAIYGEPNDLDLISKGIVFALRGKRVGAIEDVSIDFLDNAGNIWRVHRSRFETKFFQNGAPISFDHAQKSMLGSLLDLDIDMSAAGGVACPIVMRSIQYDGQRFVGWDAETARDERANQTPANSAIGALVEECASIAGKPEFRDPVKLAQIAESIIEVHGHFTEVNSMGQSVASNGEHAPSFSMIETLSKELDHLQHIDFLFRKISDGSDSPQRLNTQLESIEVRLSELTSKWSSASIDIGVNHERWLEGIELLVRARGYAKLAETANRIKKICVEKLRPIANTAMESWNDFLTGTSRGQELESCLASMLLGIKKFALDLEKMPVADSAASNTVSSNWFDKLRGAQAREAERPEVRSGALIGHQTWLERAIHDIEAIKESLDFSLKQSQIFLDESVVCKDTSAKGLALLEELSEKASSELARLNTAWSQWANEASIPESIAVDSFCQLGRDANEFQILSFQKASLAVRLEERSSVQNQLEALVRQWWNVIGSDRNIDVSNTALLISEARAALRHRDTRRQRVQKIVKDSAKVARDEAILQWTHKRRSELLSVWSTIFTTSGLPILEVGENALQIARLGLAIKAMHRIQSVESDSSRPVDVWHEGEAAVVRIYRFDVQGTAEAEKKLFVDFANRCPTVMDSCVNIFLVDDESLSKSLHQSGYGSAIQVTSSEGHPVVNADRLQSANTPRKSNMRGGATKSDGAREQSPERAAALPVAPASSPQSSKGISAKAAAALSILNPKAKDTFRS